MKQHLLFVLFSSFAFLTAQTQNTSPYWSLNGNSNADVTSKLGTTNLVPLNLVTNNLTRMRIDAAGKVGIGTFTPLTRFHVNGYGAFGNMVTTLNATRALNLADDNAVMRILRVHLKFAPAIELISRTSADGPNVAYWDMYAEPGDASLRIRDRVTGANLDRVTISNIGNVGIGTTTPNSRLSVKRSDGQFMLARFTNGSTSGDRSALVEMQNGDGVLWRYGVGGTGNSLGLNTGQFYIERAGKESLFTMTQEGNVGIGTTSPHASALLDLTSTTKGMLTTRMTQAQRNAIAAPALGLFIYQTDNTPGFYYYDGVWKSFTTSSSSSANTALSNLSATAVNVDLLPGTTAANNLGVAGRGWKSLHLTEGLYLNNGLFLHNKGSNNTFVGEDVGTRVVVESAGGGDEGGYEEYGSENTGVGSKALFYTTTGNSNTASGYGALYFNTSGSDNTANGRQALYQNTTGNVNTAFGSQALIGNLTGAANTASGHGALWNTNGSLNTAVGFYALPNNAIGWRSTAVGAEALNSDRYGSYNTALGYFANVSSWDGTFTNSTVIGANAIVDASNKVRIGNTAITSIGGQVGWTTFSDGRYKRNIKEDVQGLSFINSLRPITYAVDVKGVSAHYNKGKKEPKDEQRRAAEEKAAAIMKESEEKASKIVYNGFVAQEVEETARKLKYEFSGIDKPQTEGGLYGLRYSDFVVPLVKAVQELSKDNEELKKKVAYVEELKKENADIKQQLAELKALITRSSGNNVSVSVSSAYLEQNSPNPSRGTTTIRYNVPESTASARLTLTNSKGQLLKTISITGRGTGQVNLETSALPAGVYNYSLWVEGREVETKKLVITR